MEGPIRVFIVDDHEMVRSGLRRMLELEKDLEVVGEAGSAEEALRLVEDLIPHIILMDIKMPNVNGLAATRHFKSRGLPGEVIILSLYEEYLAQAVEAGAGGYLVKDVKREELVDAIRRVAQGDLVLGGSLATTPEITERTIGYLRDVLRKTRSTHSQGREPGDAATFSEVRLEGEAIRPRQDTSPQTSLTPPTPPPDAGGQGNVKAHESGAELEHSSERSDRPTREPFRPPHSGELTWGIPRVPVIRRGTASGSKEQAFQVASSPLPVSPELPGDGTHISSRTAIDKAIPSIMTNGSPTNLQGWEKAESTLVQQIIPPSSDPDEGAELFEADVELVIAPPVETFALLKLHRWLQEMLQAEVEETSGTWDGGTSLRILLKRPTLLLKMLETVPEVVEAKEEYLDAMEGGRRFLKRRKGQPKPTLAPPRRVRLVLYSPFSPKQLSLELDEGLRRGP